MSPSFILVSMFAANSPDIDFLFGFLAGAPDRFHHQFTHGFFFAATFGLLCALFVSRTQKGGSNDFLPLFYYFSFLALLHIILDCFCQDTTAPFGLMLFWPLSETYFISPFSFFDDIKRSPEIGQFFSSLLTPHNGKAVLRETLITAALIPVAQGIERHFRAGQRRCSRALWK